MKRYRIGLMAGSKSIDYVHSIRLGVQNTLEDKGHVLVAITDLIPFHTRTNAKAYFRVAFEVAARLELDAIIVPAGIIAGYLADDIRMLDEFMGILDPTKTLVIERGMEGFRSITKDNARGMHECMRHVIEDCGFQKIAWIGGPENSKGAQEREEIYFQEMAAHGLDTPPRLITHGDFSGDCEEEVERLIDRNHDLEAIVCCCDLIAHTVYRVMRRRRLSVGTDIAVTGFDDDEQSSHLDPPLSTVHMTGYDLGCMAAREAVRICEGKSQQETQLSSSFVVRGSCGEKTQSQKAEFVDLFSQRPLPTDVVVQKLLEPTLTMAGRSVTDDFRSAMRAFVNDVKDAYVRHCNEENDDDWLFSSQDLTMLFNRDYRDNLSLEGFHSVAILMLQALADASPIEVGRWVIDQVSDLHLGIARMLNAQMAGDRQAMSRREWVSFHMTDDALRESTHPELAYRLILQEFQNLGVTKADLYLLPEPVSFMGSRTFALSDTLQPIGRLAQGRIRAASDERTISLQNILDRLVTPYGGASIYTVGGIMAGDELVGIAALDSGTLDDDGQLIAFLNLGIAIKHLQMIATERESNELLSQSNLMLERQSHYDEMTGALNRRGFMSKLERMMALHMGQMSILFYFDLDGLKKINDTYGHDAGDEAITQTTRVLGACLPPDALIGRLGGDEFVAFVLVDSDKSLTTLGTSIEVGMATFNATHSYPFDLSISYGGVPLTIDEKSFANATQTLVVADERLYEMKRRKGTARR